MPHHNTAYRQLTKQLPQAELRRSIKRHRADKGTRRLGTQDLLHALLLAQLCGARSLRDLVSLLESQDARRYHSGLPAIARSTLADALARRPAAVFSDVLGSLIGTAMARLPREIGACVRLIDSTILPLNAASAGWARFSAKLCGAKAHVVYDPDADCPVYFGFTPARVNDITAAKAMPIEPGCTYVFDLGYYDYAWWAELDRAGCRIVTRLRASTPLQAVEVLPVQANETTPSAILSDTIGFLPQRQKASRRNPMADAVREVRVRLDNGTVLRVISNDLDAPAAEIAALYKRRWAVELFFRWIKQTLKLRHFLGTSENAVRIQIAVALIAFVLIKLAHGAQTAITGLTQFGRLLQANILHRIPIQHMGRHGPPPLQQTCNRQMVLL